MDTKWHKNGIRSQFCCKLASGLKTIIFVVPEPFFHIFNLDKNPCENQYSWRECPSLVRNWVADVPRWSRDAPGRPKTPHIPTQDTPKMMLKPPHGVSKTPQEGSETHRATPKAFPKPQGALKTPQGAPSHSPRRPKATRANPRGFQKPPSPPSSLRFWSIFAMIWDHCNMDF